MRCQGRRAGGNAREKFTATAYYGPDGDCIEFLARPDNFYAERVDDLVTVYYSEDTGEVLGSLIKGVTSLRDELLKRLPGFQIEIRHGKVKLVHIFRARLWASEMDHAGMAILTYQKLIEVAGQTDIEVELKKAG
jgi:hypothetical protein